MRLTKKQKTPIIHKFIENKEIFTFSSNSAIKDYSTALFGKVMERIKAGHLNKEFEAILNFKEETCDSFIKREMSITLG